MVVCGGAVGGMGRGRHRRGARLPTSGRPPGLIKCPAANSKPSGGFTQNPYNTRNAHDTPRTAPELSSAGRSVSASQAATASMGA